MGAVVEVFAGPLVKYADVPEDEVRYALLFGDAWVLPRTNARYINHSCDANCFVSDTREVVARRRIRAGEELTIMYNGISMEEFLAGSALDEPWDARWTFDCRCGSPRCIRKIDRYVVVTAHDHNGRNVYLGVSPGKGRGVFARRPIAAGEVFETAPVLVVPAAEWSSIEKTVFFDYTFEWGWEGETAAIALGYGSLYNHSYTPNARYEKRLEDGRHRLRRAARDPDRGRDPHQLQRQAGSARPALVQGRGRARVVRARAASRIARKSSGYVRPAQPAMVAKYVQ